MEAVSDTLKAGISVEWVAIAAVVCLHGSLISFLIGRVASKYYRTTCNTCLPACEPFLQCSASIGIASASESLPSGLDRASHVAVQLEFATAAKEDLQLTAARCGGTLRKAAR